MRSDSWAHLASQSYMKLRAMDNHLMEIPEKSDDDVSLRSDRRKASSAVKQEFAPSCMARRMQS